MNDSSTNPFDSEINILDFVSELYRFRYWSLLLSLMIASAVYSGTYLMQERYESITRVIVVEPDDPGGVSPDNRRAPEVMTLVEHGFILGTTRDNWRDVIRARMRSRTFTEIFIHKAKVAQSLYPQLWDAGKQAWIDEEPDKNQVFAEFHENIRFVDHDPKTDIISVRIRWTDPKQASKWANQYVVEFNQYMRERALEDSRTKREYLLQQAENTEIVEMQKSVYRLIEAQTAVMMLAESKQEYAVEVLDQAYTPFERFSPARKRITLMAGVAAMLLAQFFLGIRMVVRRIRRQIQESCLR